MVRLPREKSRTCPSVHKSVNAARWERAPPYGEGRLMHALFDPLFSHQLVKDSQHQLPILVHPVELLLHLRFVTVPKEQLIEKFAGDVDIAAQGVGRVSPQE